MSVELGPGIPDDISAERIAAARERWPARPNPGCSRREFDAFRAAYLSKKRRAMTIVLAGVAPRSFHDAGMTARAAGADVAPENDALFACELTAKQAMLRRYVSEVTTTYHLERFLWLVDAIPRVDDYLSAFADFNTG